MVLRASLLDDSRHEVLDSLGLPDEGNGEQLEHVLDAHSVPHYNPMHVDLDEHHHEGQHHRPDHNDVLNAVDDVSEHLVVHSDQLEQERVMGFLDGLPGQVVLQGLVLREVQLLVGHGYIGDDQHGAVGGHGTGLACVPDLYLAPTDVLHEN